MRLLRRLAALVTLLAMSLAAALFLAPGALAGGPTSVLISSPESGETAGLSYSNAEYDQLSALLGSGSSGETNRPPTLDAMTGIRQINVTWMLHDVTPWRVDRVYPSDDGGAVWIHTTSNVPESHDGLWHKAAKPAELTALLKRLRVMGKKSAEGVPGIPPQSSWETGGAAAEQPGQAAAPAGGPTDWWWAIPGFVAGAALGLALQPLAARLPRPLLGGRDTERDSGPRQQLLDL
ncbi:hypothetical protein ACWGI8_06360 [Streptomyces sp. NPDC054841]